MDQTARRFIVSHYEDLRESACALIEGVADEQMILQPVAGVVMNHPAWILSHLAPYGPFLEAILRQAEPIDPIGLPHSMKTSPSDDPAAYLPRLDLLEQYERGYDGAAKALLEADESLFAEPPPVERFQGRFPTVGALPIQFLVKHNAMHLGQLSAWRRAMGMGPV